MFRVRTVNDVDEFVGVPGDPDGYTDTVKGLWDSVESQPDWCFLIEDGPTKLGRVGFRVSPTVSDPSLQGSLPAQELFVYGLHLQWEDDYLKAGRRLIAEATAAVSAELPELLEVRINNSVHPFAEERVHLMNDMGMHLFQEKDGFFWSDDGHIVESGDRLEFLSIADTGLEAYRAVMAPCGLDTLDRNDRYYWTGCGPDNWAAQMTEYLVDEDTHMWLIGYRDDEPVGYVAVLSVEDWGSTIGHVGVVPQHRGHGHIHDLLTAGTTAAQRSGITSMLSDVDVLNDPMLKAMRRAGHIRDPKRWHLWVFRSKTSALAMR
jgi:ribosomal protein S18 acetylase RimI-like enzyme